MKELEQSVINPFKRMNSMLETLGAAAINLQQSDSAVRKIEFCVNRFS